MREVSWLMQGRLKSAGTDSEWTNRPDLSYTGWFHSTGEDEPSEALVRDVEQARADHPHMDFRVLQKTRSFETKVLDL